MDSTQTILLVEDDRDFAESLKLLLQMKGHEVTTVASGEEALDVYSETDFSFVLMDIKLPGLSGVETLDNILESSPQAQVLLMTGCERGSAEVITATMAGAIGVLYKPFRINELLSMINK